MVHSKTRDASQPWERLDVVLEQAFLEVAHGHWGRFSWEDFLAVAEAHDYSIKGALGISYKAIVQRLVIEIS